MTPRRPAAFLDRDGTIIEDQDYPGDPDRVTLLPGAADAIARLNRLDVPVVVVTNQSGIGRGYITEQEYAAVHARMVELLAAEGAAIGAVYHCPHAPDRVPPCDCRKPEPGLYRRAGAEHGLDLARSAFIGDRLRDVVPGTGFGGRGLLILGHHADPSEIPREVEPVRSLVEAVDTLLSSGWPN